MTLTEYARLVRETRQAQRKYFHDRTREALSASKALELRLDLATAGILDADTLDLFGGRP